MGILPLTFNDEEDHETTVQGDRWEIRDIHAALEARQNLTVRNLSQDRAFEVGYDLTERHVTMLLAGGLLNTVSAD